ncbi:unnamed protein product [Oikopleura dioica]|uniref:Uncharacterized protein n=1 Tax=Oikopleura dioica TaxID=34765 RepID=E4YVP6_OIKDI|nr:unnamed protein product [Oikopleura dioica]
MIRDLDNPSCATGRLLLEIHTGEYFMLVKGAEFTEAFYDKFGKFAVLPTFQPELVPGPDETFFVKTPELLRLAMRYALAFPADFNNAIEVLEWAGLARKRCGAEKLLPERLAGFPVCAEDCCWRLTLVKTTSAESVRLNCNDELIPEWVAHLTEAGGLAGTDGRSWKVDGAEEKCLDYLYWCRAAAVVMKVASTLFISKARLVLARDLVRLLVLDGPAELIVKAIEKEASQVKQLDKMIMDAPGVLLRIIQLLQAGDDLDDSQLRARLQRSVTNIATEHLLPTRSEEDALLTIIEDQIESKRLQMVLQATEASRSNEEDLDELTAIFNEQVWTCGMVEARLISKDVVLERLGRMFGIGLRGLGSTQNMIMHTLGQGCARCKSGPPATEVGSRWTRPGNFYLLLDWMRVLGKQVEGPISTEFRYFGISMSRRAGATMPNRMTCPADWFTAFQGLTFPAGVNLTSGVFNTRGGCLDARCLERFAGRLELFNMLTATPRRKVLLANKTRRYSVGRNALVDMNEVPAAVTQTVILGWKETANRLQNSSSEEREGLSLEEGSVNLKRLAKKRDADSKDCRGDKSLKCGEIM